MAYSTFSERVINGEPIAWDSWINNKNITPEEGAKLAHLIEPSNTSFVIPAKEKYSIERLQGQLKNKQSAYTLEALVDFLTVYDIGEKDSWSTYRKSRHFYRYRPLKDWRVFTPEFRRKERPDLPDIRRFNIPSGMIDVVSRQSPVVLEDVGTVSQAQTKKTPIYSRYEESLDILVIKTGIDLNVLPLKTIFNQVKQTDKKLWNITFATFLRDVWPEYSKERNIKRQSGRPRNI